MQVGDLDCRVLVDSGIGVTIIATATADAVGATDLGRTFSGKRMSGQEVTVPLVRLPDVTIGGYVVSDHVAGVIDLGSTGSGATFDGILGLDLFAAACLTVDPHAQVIVVSDSPPTDGVVVPVEVRRDDGSVAMYTDLELPDGQVVRVEVDTGSQALILDDRYLAACGVADGDPRIEVRQGTDETGYVYTRRFIDIEGAVRIPGEPSTAQQSPRVQFQQITYDGLIGTAFLDRFRYTFDVRGEQIVLEPW